MRRILIGGLLIVLALFIGASLVRHRKPLDLAFRSRAAIYPGVMGKIWPAVLSKTIMQDHKTESDRVLLIRDHLVLDHPDFDSYPASLPAKGTWAFASIMRRAYDQARMTSGLPGSSAPQLQGLTDAWRTDMEANSDEYFKNALDRFRPLWNYQGQYLIDRVPVRLLAIANRIDLAQAGADGCASADMGNVEIRFDFAATDKSPQLDYFRLIIEFVMPCLSPSGKFSQLAKDWQGLADPKLSMNDGSYQKALEGVLENWIGQSTKARLRIAAQPPGGGPWAILEYAFDGNAGLVPHDLTREINVEFPVCQKSTSDLGKFARTHETEIRATRYEITGSLATLQLLIDPEEPFVLTLGADDGLTGAPLDEVRHVLSINTCRGCHSLEAGVNGGVHLSQRQYGHDSMVSGFLSGQPVCADGTDTSIEDFCRVQPKPADNCNGTPAQQKYNDLLRRHQYLDAIINPKSAPGTPDWTAQLSRYVAKEVE